MVYGFEFTPTILSEECGQVEQQKEIHTTPNDCPYIVDISAFTDDSETLYISSTTYISKYKIYIHLPNHNLIMIYSQTVCKFKQH